MRYPTLVPTFRSIARSIADDAIAEDIALGVDHRLYRQSAQFDNHLVAWGAFLTAREALERVRGGAASTLSADRLDALEALPAAALTVVVLRDGAGFSDDAIAVAVDRPLHEVRWLSNTLPPNAVAPDPEAEREPEVTEVAPAEAGSPEGKSTKGEPREGVPAEGVPGKGEPREGASGEGEPGQAAQTPPIPPPFGGVAPGPAPIARPTEPTQPVAVPQPPPTVGVPDLGPAPRPNRRRAKTLVAIAVAVALVVVIVIAAVIGANKAEDRAERAEDPSDGAVVSNLFEGPQLNTVGCDSANAAATLAPRELTLAGNGYTSVATVRAPTPVEGPRPMIIAFVPPGTPTGDWLAATRIEATAAQHGAVLATLQPSSAEGWAVPVGRELTTDLDALARLLNDVGAQTCVDPARVTTIGFANAADFAMAVACNYPRVSSHVVTIAGSVPNDNCVRFDGRGLLAALDGSLSTYPDAVERFSGFIIERSCPEPTYSNQAEFSLAVSQACERNAQFWLAAASGITVWNATIDDLLEQFLAASGALDPQA